MVYDGVCVYKKNPRDGVPIGFNVNKKDDLMVIWLGYTLR